MQKRSGRQVVNRAASKVRFVWWELSLVGWLGCRAR
jgi:hypothetical protein